MLKKVAETLIGGALGAIALYVVGRVAFEAGKEVAKEECRYAVLHRANAKEREKAVTSPSIHNVMEEPKENTVIPATVVSDYQPQKKQSKLGLLLGVRKIFENRKSVLRNLVNDPEAHKFEAFVEGDELQIHVKRKEVS